jgi:hypothetical protein
VKFNVDAGVSIDSGTESTGAILRDRRGLLLLLFVVEFLLFLMHLLQKHEHCKRGYFLLVVILVVIG